MKDSRRPYIAKDTKKPLVVFGHYRVSETGGVIHEIIERRDGDYGADPLPDGRFRMVPSGDVVDFDERNRRLKR